ncbi:MAG TPA: hypothetical protein VIV40_37295, partial [Kofleriaceae bacterium]
MFQLSSRHFLLTVAMSLAACADEAASGDVCEQAADHRASCLGEYVTPPVCDAAAEESARYLLSLSCEEVANLGAQGKADGAFCDWFGLGCTPDEPIFQGASCTSSADCASGSVCLERRCFAGYESAEFATMMNTWTQSAETSGSTTHLLAGNAET